MTLNKVLILKLSLRTHKTLAWIGGLGIFIYLISALMHPLMIWTGPRAQSFYPPQSAFKAEHLARIPDILSRHEIQKAAVIKMIPTGTGPLLQITLNKKGERKYFDPQTGAEIADFDQVQAEWLARYYSGLKTPVKAIELITEFSDDYSWVNRLLPVYKVIFETEDNARIYVHTELGAMAGYTNDRKAMLQWIFQKFHTWNWLDNLEAARLLVILVFIAGIIALLLSGLSFLILMKNQRKLGAGWRLHRTIAYLVVAPLLCLAISGTIHLIFSSQSQKTNGLEIPTPFELAGAEFDDNLSWLLAYKDVPLNAISLLPDGAGGFVYRLGIPAQNQEAADRLSRFDGLPKEQPGHYYDISSGALSALDDPLYARRIVEQITADSPVQIQEMKLITRFGPEYDFRNKRLPVWKITLSAGQSTSVFVDPATGQVVDQMTAPEKLERYSFSYLHKWDPLVTGIGRIGRDIVVFAVLFMSFFLSIAGVVLLVRKPTRKNRKKAA